MLTQNASSSPHIDLSGNGAGVFTDLDFSFTAVDGGDKCTDTKDLAVTIEVLSDEVVTTGEEVSYMERLYLHVVTLTTCTHSS